MKYLVILSGLIFAASCANNPKTVTAREPQQVIGQVGQVVERAKKIINGQYFNAWGRCSVFVSTLDNGNSFLVNISRYNVLNVMSDGKSLADIDIVPTDELIGSIDNSNAVVATDRLVQFGRTAKNVSKFLRVEKISDSNVKVTITTTDLQTMKTTAQSCKVNVKP